MTPPTPNPPAKEQKPIQFWRYSLPSENGEGWAVIFIDSRGVFSAVSDYGNYGYVWSHHGRESIKHFLLESRNDWHYFANKFDPKEITDWDATEKCIRDHIALNRKEGNYTKEFARAELERLERCNITGGEIEFHEWYLNTKLGDPGEFIVRRMNYSVEHFAKKTLPRLCNLLQADIEAEK